MKIKYTPLKAEGLIPAAMLHCELCGKLAAWHLKFTGFDAPMYVCARHETTITPDNPLLIPFLQLLNIYH